MNSIIFLVLIVFEGNVGSRDDGGDGEFVGGSKDCGFESFFLSFDLFRFDGLLGEAMKTKRLKESFETKFFEFETIIVDDDLKTDLRADDVEEERNLLIKSCFLIFFSVVSIAIVALLVALSCFFNIHNFFLIEDDFESFIEISVFTLAKASCVEMTLFVKIST